MTTIALAPLQPFARLLRMSDNTVRATTHMLLGGTSRSCRMNAVSGCALVVPLSDPGDASAADISGGKLGFAATLMQAAGGPGGISTPVPMLLSISLDGGTSYDFHRLVQKPMRDSDPARLTLTESGEDIFTEYSKIPAGGGRSTLVGCKLVDVLGALPGAIVPLSTGDFDYQGFIGLDHKIPFESGLLYPAASLFQDIPGNTAWDNTALALLRFVAVVATQGFTDEDVLALDTPTTIDTWADNQQHAIAVLVEKLGAVVLPGDTQPLGSRGNWVADCSDYPLNVAGSMVGCVADGTPGTATYPTTAGQYGRSNARTSGREISRSVIIGSVGAPSSLLFTDTPSSAIIDETAEAHIITGKVTIERDLTVLHGACSFDGGASDAGFPAGAKITALTQLNRDGGNDAWSTCLPIVGINVSDKIGGVYYFDTLGQLVPLNKSQSIAVLDLQVDGVNQVIDIATPHGVYNRTTDVTNPTAAWVQVGGLTARVVRLALPVVGGVAYLWAQVSDPQNRRLDGIYVYIPSLAVATRGSGYNGWVRRHLNANLLETGDGFTSTDGHSFFYIDKADQAGVFLWDSTASPVTRKLLFTTNGTTPVGGVVALHLDRVIGIGDTPIDTVYCTVSDGSGTPQVAYYSKYVSGAWTNFIPTYLAVNLPGLQVSRFVAVNETINGLNYVSVVACTGNGLYYSQTNTPTATDGSDWVSMNDQSGLAGVNCTNVSAGAPQNILGQTASRVYATTDTDLYMSGNGSVQFDNVTRARVDLGPYFTALVIAGTAGYPTNSVQTVGPMSSSPLGLASDTHVQVTTYQGSPVLPTGWYYWRRLNKRGMWEWRLINPDCPFTAPQEDQLSDVVADETQDALTASSIVAAVSRKWLGQNSAADTILHLPSFFTQTNAVLRKLQPGQLVSVTMSGTIPQRSSTGEILDNVWVDFENEDFYVLDGHTWTLANPGAPYCDTMTPVGKILRSRILTPQEMASAFQRQLRDVKVWATGRGRH